LRLQRIRRLPWNQTATFATALAAVLLAGCADVGAGNIGESLPQAWGGISPDAPKRPAVEAPYPAVHDLPPERAERPLDADQQLRLQKDLAATRARQHKLQDPKVKREGADAAAATTAARDKAKAKAGVKPHSD
jgi:hypothetical protein